MTRHLKKYGLTAAFCVFILAKASFASADWANGLMIAETYSNLPSGLLVEDVVINVMLWLLRIFTYIAVIGFIVAGIMYITAGGDTTRADTARKSATYAIIGIAVSLAGYIVIAQIDELLY